MPPPPNNNFTVTTLLRTVCTGRNIVENFLQTKYKSPMKISNYFTYAKNALHYMYGKRKTFRKTTNKRRTRIHNEIERKFTFANKQIVLHLTTVQCSDIAIMPLSSKKGIVIHTTTPFSPPTLPPIQFPFSLLFVFSLSPSKYQLHTPTLFRE